MAVHLLWKNNARRYNENQDNMQTAYHVEEPIEIFFDQIETGQEFTIAVNFPFSDRHIDDMGITQILETTEYTHAYCMWKIFSMNKHTWVHFKSYFKEAYLDRE